MDKKAFGKLSYGLYIASSTFEGKNAGCVINSLQQATSSAPQKFTVTLNKDNFTREIVEKSGFLAVTVLDKEADLSVINEFGFKSSRVVNKFEKFETAVDENNMIYVKQFAAARLGLRVLDQVDLGSYILFITEATSAELIGGGDPLTVAYYQEAKNGTTPPAAPIFRTLESSYRCQVCGYVYKSDTIADDYRCPICGAPAEKFVKV